MTCPKCGERVILVTWEWPGNPKRQVRATYHHARDADFDRAGLPLMLHTLKYDRDVAEQMITAGAY